MKGIAACLAMLLLALNSHCQSQTITLTRQQLKDKISQFLHVIDDPSFTTMLHPFFGDLDKEEWLLFQYKHFYHHLSQFGLMPSI